MRGKILILTGLAVGYVLGARAGRERYEEIKESATKLWNDPRVKSKVDAVEDFAKDKGPDVAEFVSDKAKKVVNQVNGNKKKATNTSPSTTKTTTPSSTPGTTSS
ncbi:YtxH domain-containing protein [Salinibacterium sp. SYSU T00001]|uniref:YtxH domain-containing protein n=1 Tax=Homoserinimonas sedimenticola TaxID=2986805 RepID=UPI002235F87D|nr:YtxH domain-containing protein [Salinibacterium sedimenticola]MCW4385847.1 YtxH domain-containing protein [Salinibacterium sedimenticola]